MKNKVLLATFGTHGDLHPMLAVAIALKARGVEPTLAAAEIYRDKVTSAGIGFHAMRPDLDAVAQRLGMRERELVRIVANRPDFLIRQVILPHLRESYEDVLPVAREADLMVTQSAAYGARIAADKCGVPHVGIVLQPMILMSAYDPPVVANMPRFSRWVYARGLRATRAFLELGKALAHRWAKPIHALRREVGLPAMQAHPLFEGQLQGEQVIGLFSPLFGPPQADHPPRTSIVGFAFYDSETGGHSSLEPALDRFLANGDAPIVFTQGTSAVHDADDFVRESLAAVDALGARAVFVLDAARAQEWSSRASSSVFVSGYAPYSLLFPRAAANVHHGGVGTTAQALRAGRPQLIAPYLVDQPDNAARVERLGAGRVLELNRYRGDRVAEALRALLNDARYSERAREVGERIANEEGAAAAADIIVETLRGISSEAQPHTGERLRSS